MASPGGPVFCTSERSADCKSFELQYIQQERCLLINKTTFFVKHLRLRWSISLRLQFRHSTLIYLQSIQNNCFSHYRATTLLEGDPLTVEMSVPAGKTLLLTTLQGSFRKLSVVVQSIIPFLDTMKTRYYFECSQIEMIISWSQVPFLQKLPRFTYQRLGTHKIFKLRAAVV